MTANKNFSCVKDSAVLKIIPTQYSNIFQLYLKNSLFELRSVNVGQSITELSKVDFGGLEEYEIQNIHKDH